MEGLKVAIGIIATSLVCLTVASLFLGVNEKLGEFGIAQKHVQTIIDGGVFGVALGIFVLLMILNLRPLSALLISCILGVIAAVVSGSGFWWLYLLGAIAAIILGLFNT